jgi:hypothetical protein
VNTTARAARATHHAQHPAVPLRPATANTAHGHVPCTPAASVHGEGSGSGYWLSGLEILVGGRTEHQPAEE